MRKTIKQWGLKRMMYLVLPVVAGLAITLQSTLSGNLSIKIGTMETTLLIHFFGFLTALLVFVLTSNQITDIFGKINYVVIIAGSLGVFIVYSLATSININGVATTIMISIMIQLIASSVIDHFGLFGITKHPINIPQLLSLGLVLTGVILFQLNKT